MDSKSQNESQSKSELVLEPWFPKATEILFYTGNMLTCSKLLRQSNSTVAEQMIECISMLLQMTNTEMDKKQFQEESYVKIRPIQEDSPSAATNGATAGSPLENEQLTREHMKFSVKIFLRHLEPEVLAHTIDTVLSELKETYLESVMIALPNYADHLTLDEFMPLWRVLEKFIDKKKILSAAVCDFKLPLLSDFYNAAQHKPYANQINLGVCCAIPDELNRYVKENSIQLLTHSDPIDVLTDSDFQQAIREHCHVNDALNWKPCSIVRYTSVITHRGIIRSKGFFMYAKRELHMP